MRAEAICVELSLLVMSNYESVIRSAYLLALLKFLVAPPPTKCTLLIAKSCLRRVPSRSRNLNAGTYYCSKKEIYRNNATSIWDCVERVNPVHSYHMSKFDLMPYI